MDEHSPTLRSGESIGDALEALGEGGLRERVGAFLFNCTSPEIISRAVPLLLAQPLLPPSALVGGYANGFVTAESGEGEYRDLSPEEYYTSFVAKWIGEAKPAGEILSQHWPKLNEMCWLGGRGRGGGCGGRRGGGRWLLRDLPAAYRRHPRGHHVTR